MRNVTESHSRHYQANECKFLSLSLLPFPKWQWLEWRKGVWKVPYLLTLSLFRDVWAGEAEPHLTSQTTQPRVSGCTWMCFQRASGTLQLQKSSRGDWNEVLLASRGPVTQKCDVISRSLAFSDALTLSSTVQHRLSLHVIVLQPFFCCKLVFFPCERKDTGTQLLSIKERKCWKTDSHVCHATSSSETGRDFAELEPLGGHSKCCKLPLILLQPSLPAASPGAFLCRRKNSSCGIWGEQQSQHNDNDAERRLARGTLTDSCSCQNQSAVSDQVDAEFWPLVQAAPETNLLQGRSGSDSRSRKTANWASFL